MNEINNLVVEIKREAISGNKSVLPLLRKCQVLASLLKNVDLKHWVACELNGYKGVKDLPNYRIVRVENVGNFAGAFGSSLSNAPIPLAGLGAENAKSLSRSCFMDGIGSIEGLLAADKDDRLAEVWPADFIAAHASKFYVGYNLIQAYKMISRSDVSGMIEAIRNKVLEFVLEFQERLPDLMDDSVSAEENKSVVQKIVNTYILGDGNRVATGCGIVEQNVINFEKGNWAYLEGVLKQLKVAQEDIVALKGILNKDPPKSKLKLGDRLNGWLGGIAAKAAQAGYDIPIGIGLAAILKFCGLN